MDDQGNKYRSHQKLDRFCLTFLELAVTDRHENGNAGHHSAYSWTNNDCYVSSILYQLLLAPDVSTHKLAHCVMEMLASWLAKDVSYQRPLFMCLLHACHLKIHNVFAKLAENLRPNTESKKFIEERIVDGGQGEGAFELLAKISRQSDHPSKTRLFAWLNDHKRDMRHAEDRAVLAARMGEGIDLYHRAIVSIY